MSHSLRLQYGVKRALDVALSATALVILGPLSVAIAIAIRATSEGAIVFRQTRVGMRGRPFTMYKFRTMRPTGGIYGSGPSPARITPIGRILRRTSLDEIPQLLNVLKGDMAIVGPRPDLPQQVERYTDHQRQRLLAKPGITGLAQVTGRNEIPWEQRFELDIEYIQGWNLLRDLQLMVRTIGMVLTGKGTGLPTG